MDNIIAMLREQYFDIIMSCEKWSRPKRDRLWHDSPN